jgi:flagellar hook-associated protein 3 FlgL
MRISTLTLQEKPVQAMQRQQAALARTQTELASGRRAQTPADDPVAAGRIDTLERTLAASKQYATNAELAAMRLSLEEGALADAGNVLQRVRELAVQANSGALDDGSRRLIGSELRQLRDQLLEVANRADGAGGYLFGGLRDGAAPFARNAAGVSYAGDSLTREVEVSPSQRVAVGHSGEEVFRRIQRGNGTFTTAVLPGNTGSGRIDTGTVVDPGAWVPDDYELRFGAAGAWQLVDDGGAVRASGTHAAGQSIEFLGVRVTITGTPASGDRYAIAPAGRGDVFGTLDGLIAAVEAPRAPGPAGAAQFSTAMGGLQQDLGNAFEHLLAVRADTGARLAGLEATGQAREALELELNTTLSSLRDVDYAEAISRMNAQMVGLQAAQQSYAQVARMSLFDYL